MRRWLRKRREAWREKRRREVLEWYAKHGPIYGDDESAT